MILTNDRAPLDDALGGNFTVCVLRGAAGSDADTAHTCLEGNWGPQSYYKWFLVTDDSLLTAAEITQWFGDDSGTDYAFLGLQSKSVTSSGAAANDLL